jgi:hypothetical protein
MAYSISGSFAFYGYIPEGSAQLHLGIVLGVKQELIKYCYCTSKFTKIVNETDFIKIPAEKLKVYFAMPKDTYIFLSARHIIDIFLVTFVSRLGSEYDVKEPIETDIYIAILSKIRNSDNLPERFKKEFFEFVE